MIRVGDTLLLACRIWQGDLTGVRVAKFTATDDVACVATCPIVYCRGADREPLDRYWPEDRIWLAGYLVVTATDVHDGELTVRLPDDQHVLVDRSQVPYRLEMVPTWQPTA